MPPLTMSAANLKWHKNLYFIPNSLSALNLVASLLPPHSTPYFPFLPQQHLLVLWSVYFYS
jgi:hypothetical protein